MVHLQKLGVAELFAKEVLLGVSIRRPMTSQLLVLLKLLNR